MLSVKIGFFVITYCLKEHGSPVIDVSVGPLIETCPVQTLHWVFFVVCLVLGEH